MRALRTKWIRVLSILLVTVIFGLLMWRLVGDWHNLPPGFFQNVKAVPLIGSLVGLVVAFLIVSFRWGFTLQTVGASIRWWDAAQIWFLSQAGRYAPGGIWNYVARLYLGRDHISEQAIIASMMLETGLRVVSEMLVFLFSLPFWPNKESVPTNSVLLIVGCTVLGLVFLHPGLLRWLLNLEIVQRVGLQTALFSDIRYSAMLGLVGYYVLSVTLVGGSFFLLVLALYPVPVSFLPFLIGSLAISAVLGFLFPFVPNGWGVREGVLAFLLSENLPTSVSIVIAMASRIWLTVGEAFWIGVMTGLWVRKRRDTS